MMKIAILLFAILATAAAKPKPCSSRSGGCGGGGYETRVVESVPSYSSQSYSVPASYSSDCSRSGGCSGSSYTSRTYETQSYSTPVRSSGCSRSDGGCASYTSRVVETPVYTSSRVVETPVYTSRVVETPVRSSGCSRSDGGCASYTSRVVETPVYTSSRVVETPVYTSQRVVESPVVYSSGCSSRSGGCGSGGYTSRVYESSPVVYRTESVQYQPYPYRGSSGGCTRCGGYRRRRSLRAQA